MEINEQLIRERAYHLWEEEGRPHGRQEAHWCMAAEQVRNGQIALPSPTARRAGKGKGKGARRQARPAPAVSASAP